MEEWGWGWGAVGVTLDVTQNSIFRTLGNLMKRMEVCIMFITVILEQ